MPKSKGIPPGYPKYAANLLAYEMYKYSDFEGKSPKDFSDITNKGYFMDMRLAQAMRMHVLDAFLMHWR